MAGALLGCAYALGRHVGRKPTPVKPTVFDVESHYSAIGDTIKAHAQTVLRITKGEAIPTISEIISSHAQEIADAIKRFEYGKLRTGPVVFEASGKDLKGTLGAEPPQAG